MVKHIVMWKLKPENMEENARAIKNALEALNGRIPGLRSLKVNRCYNGYDLCLESELDTREDCAAYGGHPLHQEALKVVLPAVSERVACDYETED